MADFRSATIPHAPIQTISQVAAMRQISEKMITSRLPDGQVIRLQPPAVDLDVATDFPLAPRYGEHTQAVLLEAGYAKTEVEALLASGVAASP